MEGVPAEELCAPDEKQEGTSSVEAQPDAGKRKASDDTDSRYPGPMAPREGGVR